jgi:hypothetical protein
VLQGAVAEAWEATTMEAPYSMMSPVSGTLWLYSVCLIDKITIF